MSVSLAPGASALPRIPAYGAAALSDLMPSVAACFGVDGYRDVLELDVTGPICVLLVDGMGWHQLRRRQHRAPFLAAALLGGRSLTAGFPSTTATSLASLGVGVPPGVHGVLGYRVAEGAGTMNVLQWDPPADPEMWQPTSTVFERLQAAGVAVSQVGPGRFARAGLTQAALRGAAYVPAETPGDVVARAAAQTAQSSRSFCYAYHGDLDRIGHIAGVGSPSWAHELGQVDRLVAQLVEALPEQATLFVTADHGMVDVTAEQHVDVEADAELSAGVRVLSGEARARYLHTEPGSAADVEALWQERLGDRMWIASRDEAIAAGWFGPAVHPSVRHRIGDVVACAHAGMAAVAGVSEAGASSLIGLHGSLTPEEQDIPLLAFRGGQPCP